MTTLPKAQFLSQLTKKADDGCVESRVKLDKLRNRTNDLVDSVSDLVFVARDAVLDSLSGDSYLVRSSLEEQVDTRIVVMLQGDDIFYESLDEPYRRTVIASVRVP